MGRFFRVRLRIRRYARRHPWLTFALRSLMIFSATFGGAYGFIAGRKSEHSGYDPNAFAMGASFLFAIACVGLATLSCRLGWVGGERRKGAVHGGALGGGGGGREGAEERAR